jgi:hypothetical protein
MSRRDLSRQILVFAFAAGAALAIFAAALMPALAADVVFPPGSRIGLEPAGDLKPSKNFSGFEDADRKVAIVIFDLPAAALPELERVAESKLNLTVTPKKQEDFSLKGGTGKLLSANAQGPDFKLNRWILVAAAPLDKDLATLIGVDVPNEALAVYSDAVVRKMLASVTFRPAPIQEQLGLLPFKVTQLAGFRVSKVLPPGVVMMTEGPSDEIVKQPFVIVSFGQGAPEKPDDRARFARDLLSTAPLKDLTPTLAEDMRIGGLPGNEIRAQAKGPTNDDWSVVQWLRFATGGGGFMRVIGVGPKADWDALFPRFRAVRDGVTPREN